jgi:addiction module HigA family antidote
VTQLTASTPDEKLRELLERHGMTQRDLCRLWDLSPTYVSDLVGGRRSITARVALRLEATFGAPSAEEWMDLQRDRELRPLRRGMAGELARLRRKRVA